MVSKNKISPISLQYSNDNKKPIILTKHRNPKFESFGKCSLQKSLESYCSSTALHGCGYITTNDVSQFEQIAWFIIVLVAIILCFVLLWLSYAWSKEIPTITVIESTHFTTLDVPFPAVTICSINKISKSRAYTLAKTLTNAENVTVDELAKLFLLALDFIGTSRSAYSEYLKLGRILKANGMTDLQLLQQLVPPCREMIAECLLKGRKVECGVLFQPSKTSEGFCCSFNYLGLGMTNLDEESIYRVPKKPYRVGSSGYQTGLSVLLSPHVDDYFGTYLSSYGFRILIHDSYDYPDANAEIKVLPLNTENFIGVLPSSSYATNDVAKLRPEIRNCYFYNEKKVNVMERYSYINCLAECRCKLAYDLCGCVPMRYLNNGVYPSCGMESILCFTENANAFMGAIPGLNETILRNHRSKISPCNCLPDCELNQYPTEVASADLNRPKLTNNGTLKLRNKVIAHVYFNDMISTRYRKDIFQDWIQLLATFGGLLGLIMGFSFVTAFEFIYFLTIRPLFDCFANNSIGRS